MRANLMTPLELMARTVSMTTDSKHLTRTAADEIRESLRAIQAAERISNAGMSKVLSCSATVWSQIRNNKYGRSRELKYLLRGRQWMKDRLERSREPAADFIETSVARRIMAVCRRAWRSPCMAKVVTPAGAGKTAALREFVRRRGDRAIYVQAGEAYCTKTGLVRRLVRTLRLNAGNKANTARLYDVLRDKMSDYYAGGMQTPFCIVVDEATTLQPAAINMLRNLHDDADCRVAVVLADTARLEAELRSRHGFAGGYEQLRSRFGATWVMDPAAEIPLADVRAIADGVAAGLGCEGRLDRHAVKYLHGVAQLPGRLRNVVHRLQAVCDLADETDTAARYDVAQLDFVAQLVGMTCALDHQANPFDSAAEPQSSLRKVG